MTYREAYLITFGGGAYDDVNRMGLFDELKRRSL